MSHGEILYTGFGMGNLKIVNVISGKFFFIQKPTLVLAVIPYNPLIPKIKYAIQQT